MRKYGVSAVPNDQADGSNESSATPNELADTPKTPEVEMFEQRDGPNDSAGAPSDLTETPNVPAVRPEKPENGS